MPSANSVPSAIEAALDAGHFFLASPGRLRVQHVSGEEMPWELFHGHLLDAAQTSDVKQFGSWHVFVDGADSPADVPLLSVHWDPPAGQVFVVRRILTHGHEAYEDTPGVILSRPVEKWARELAGTIEISSLPPNEQQDELRRCVFLAVIGSSRLPITSLESPLPAFSLGHLGYFPNLHRDSARPWDDPIELLEAALGAGLSDVETAKALETALRSTPDQRQPQIAGVVERYIASAPSGWSRTRNVIGCLFNHVALSPYTDFVDRWVNLLLRLSAVQSIGPAAIIDVLATMLVHLCRHLTAFDLKTFHNYGANYPDALFLDALLKATVRLLNDHLELFATISHDSATEHTTKCRRRALRQACLVRKYYEGHLVPDAPTSEGENLRVLPAPFGRVPEEQIQQMGKRRRTLFGDESTEDVLGVAGQEVLRASVADLDDAVEVGELGMATFLDRPLGAGKQPGQVDRTPLVSYTAFSRSIVMRRLGELERAGWIDPQQAERLPVVAEELVEAGIALSTLTLAQRPGVVSLADATKAAPDFILLRSSRASLTHVLDSYDWTTAGAAPLHDLFAAERGSLNDALLIPRAAEVGSQSSPMLRLYDYRGRLRVELGLPRGANGTTAYVERGGVELPERLQVVRVWDGAPDGEELAERDLRTADIWITPRRARSTEPLDQESP